MRKGAKLPDAGRLEGLSMEEALRLLPGLTGESYLHFVFVLCLSSSRSCEESMRAPATFFFGKVKRHFLSGPADSKARGRRGKPGPSEADREIRELERSDRFALDCPLRQPVCECGGFSGRARGGSEKT